MRVIGIIVNCFFDAPYQAIPMSVSSSISPRILIIEDDFALNQQVSELLQSKGYATEQSFDGQSGLLEAISRRYDLVLLDVLLPKLDGFSVLGRLRKQSQTPVMMLTACGAEEERIQGYSKGADDYLPKPFNITELLLRVEAVLRRTRGESGSAPQSELLVGSLLLNRSDQSVKVEQQAVVMTPIEFRLLWTLIEHKGEVLTKPYLYQLVLEKEFSRYDRSLDMHMSRIRKKLEQAGLDNSLLMTVHGKGYCFK